MGSLGVCSLKLFVLLCVGSSKPLRFIIELGSNVIPTPLVMEAVH